MITPDTAAVWDFDAFKRALFQHGYVKADPTMPPVHHFMGINITVDPALEPGTIELRAGADVIRTINLQMGNLGDGQKAKRK